MSEEGKQIAKVEVQRLLDARVIRPIKYPTWLSNVVLVKKKNGKWRMCINFTSLNKACPKDDFPLPRISTLVDSAAGCELLSLLDYFLGYHQIWMNKEDEEKQASSLLSERTASEKWQRGYATQGEPSLA